MDVQRKTMMASAKEVTTQERILEALLDLIAERGFHDSPISLLAKRAKTGPGLIYHYFPSKEELIHAVYVRVRMKKREALAQGYSKAARLSVFAPVLCGLFLLAYR